MWYVGLFVMIGEMILSLGFGRGVNEVIEVDLFCV